MSARRSFAEADASARAEVRLGGRYSMVDSDALRGEVHAYLRRTDTDPCTFGKVAMGDTTFVLRLDRVATCFKRTADRARRFMAEHPDGIPRAAEPAKTRAAVGIGYADPKHFLPEPIGAVPPPTPARIAEDHPNLAPAIFAEAARRGQPVASLLSELVARGWAAMTAERAHG